VDEAHALIEGEGRDVALHNIEEHAGRAVRAGQIEGGSHQLPGDAPPPVFRQDGHIADHPDVRRAPAGHVDHAYRLAVFLPHEAVHHVPQRRVSDLQDAQQRPQPAQACQRIAQALQLVGFQRPFRMLRILESARQDFGQGGGVGGQPEGPDGHRASSFRQGSQYGY